MLKVLAMLHSDSFQVSYKSDATSNTALLIRQNVFKDLTRNETNIIQESRKMVFKGNRL